MAKYDNVETVIDRFLDYVRSNKKVSLGNVAAALGISAEQAERLAILLEQSNFVDVQYGIGDVMISVKADRPIETKEEIIEKVKAISDSEELEREVLTAENLLKFFEKDLTRRINAAEYLLEQIEKKDEVKPEDMVAVKREIDLALGQLAAFSNEIKSLADSEEHFYDKLMNFRKKLDGIKRNKGKKEKISLMEKIIVWLKHLFEVVKMVKGFKNTKLKRRIPSRKKRSYDHVQPVTFLGKSGFQAKQKRTRIFKLRTDNVKQHYWKKRNAAK